MKKEGNARLNLPTLKIKGSCYFALLPPLLARSLREFLMKMNEAYCYENGKSCEKNAKGKNN